MARFTTNIPKISKSLQQAIDITSSTSEMVNATRLSQYNLITDASKTTQLLQNSIGVPGSIAEILNTTSLSHADTLTAALSSLDTLGLGAAAEMIKASTQSYEDALAAALPPLDTLSLAGSVAEMIKETNLSYAHALTAALPSMDTFGMNSVAEMIKENTLSYEEALSAAISSLDTLGLTGSIAETIKETNLSYAEALTTTLPSLDTFGMSSAAEMIKAVQLSQQSIIDDAIQSTAFLNDINKLDSIFDSSLKALSIPEYFASAAEIIERNLADKDYMSSIPSDQLNFDNDQDLQSAIDEKDINSFKRWFERLSIYSQLFLIYVFMQILQPIINNIAANLITPYVDETISDWSNSDRDKVKTLKNLTFEEFDTPMSDLRFISGDNVRLRDMPSIKGEAIDELRIGRVVVFLSKERNWTEIMLYYNEGEPVTGWVFTRYVKRFNNVK